MFWLVRPLLARLVHRLARGRGAPCLLAVLAAGVFLSAYVTTWIGIHAIFGAFLFGFVMPREPAELLRRQLGRPLDALSLLLLPVFFIVTGLGIDIGAPDRDGLPGAGRHRRGGLRRQADRRRRPRRGPSDCRGAEAGTLGLLMNTRGLTGLIVVNAGVGLGVLDPPMFTMMVLMALITTALAGPLLPRAGQLRPTGARPAGPSGKVDGSQPDGYMSSRS